MLSKLIDDMKSAMKNGNKAELSALRNIIGKIKSKQIDSGKELTENECIKILSSSAKQLKDSIEQYRHGGREDLVKSESFELSVVKKYLPEQMNESEIESIIKKIINQLNVNSMNEMGKVMAEAMKQIGNVADGAIVQKIVRKELS